MPAMLINYDLNVPGQKYDNLIERIKAYPGWANLMKSTWMVSGSTITPQSVYDDLRPIIDDGDHLFVVDITGQRRQGWLGQKIWDWIKQHV